MLKQCCNFVELTQVGEYPDRIKERSDLCNWKFSRKDVAKLSKGLRSCDHESPSKHIGVDIDLGKGLAYNCAQAISWLKVGINELGFELKVYINPDELSALSKRQGPDLKIVELDFETFWNQFTGLSIKQVISSRDDWPGTEILWFAALNPQIIVNMNGVQIPYILIPGLEVYQSEVCCKLSIYRDDRNVYIWPVAGFCSRFTLMPAYLN